MRGCFSRCIARLSKCVCSSDAQQEAKFYSERMRILRAIAEDSVGNCSNDGELKVYSIADIVNLLDGASGFEDQRYFETKYPINKAISDSLKVTGDLESPRIDAYRVTPKAFATLADFDLETRRHDAMERIAHGTMCLTSLIFVATALGAVATALGAWAAYHSGCK